MRLIKKGFNWESFERSFATLLNRSVTPPQDVTLESKTSQLANYVGWCYICININANAVASVPWKLLTTKPTSSKKVLSKDKQDYIRKQSHISPIVKSADDLEEVTNNPIIDLLYKANPIWNEYDLKCLTDVSLDTTGDCYWYIVKGEVTGLPIEAWILEPQYMTMDVQNGVIKQYIYKKDTKDQKIYPADQIVHFLYPCLTKRYEGQSPLGSAYFSVNMLNQMDAYIQNIFASGGLFDGFLSVKNRIVSPSDKESIRKKFMEFFGKRKAGGLPVFDDDMTFQQVSANPREMPFIQGQKQAISEICAAFSVPEAMIKSEANYKQEQALIQHARNAVKPRCIRIESTITQSLIMQYNENMFLMFDNPVPEDSEAKLKETEMLAKVGGITPNEIRKRHNQDPYSDPMADLLWMPSGYMPIGSDVQAQGKAFAEAVMKELEKGEK